jgi:hypothetical protein
MANMALLGIVILTKMYKIYRGRDLIMFPHIIYKRTGGIIGVTPVIFGDRKAACPFDIEKIPTFMTNAAFYLTNGQKVYLKDVTESDLKKLKQSEQQRWFDTWTYELHKHLLIN